jgi:uncharacterized lipoprotein
MRTRLVLAVLSLAVLSACATDTVTGPQQRDEVSSAAPARAAKAAVGAGTVTSAGQLGSGARFSEDSTLVMKAPIAY